MRFRLYNRNGFILGVLTRKLPKYAYGHRANSEQGEKYSKA